MLKISLQIIAQAIQKVRQAQILFVDLPRIGYAHGAHIVYQPPAIGANRYRVRPKKRVAKRAAVLVARVRKGRVQVALIQIQLVLNDDVIREVVARHTAPAPPRRVAGNERFGELRDIRFERVAHFVNVRILQTPFGQHANTRVVVLAGDTRHRIYVKIEGKENGRVKIGFSGADVLNEIEIRHKQVGRFARVPIAFDKATVRNRVHSLPAFLLFVRNERIIGRQRF